MRKTEARKLRPGDRVTYGDTRNGIDHRYGEVLGVTENGGVLLAPIYGHQDKPDDTPGDRLAAEWRGYHHIGRLIYRPPSEPEPAFEAFSGEPLQLPHPLSSFVDLLGLKP